MQAPRVSTSFEVFRDVAPLRKFRRELLLAGRTVGFVPTMGALHAGHLSLMRQAAQENTDVIVSIYVNPTQFGLNEDLDSYPQTWDTDCDQLVALNREFSGEDGLQEHEQYKGRVTAVFAPTSKVMYPTSPPTSEINGNGSFVTITPISTRLEGASRPIFFRGVATVCMKLFNILEADIAYFGQKDIQQTCVIKQMVKDFHINTIIRVCPTEREEDGLALSSRNVYLGTRRRRVALVLIRALQAAQLNYDDGHRSREQILGAANKVLASELLEQRSIQAKERALFDVDYVSLADPHTLDEIGIIDDSNGAVLSAAIKMAPIEGRNPDESLGLGDDASMVRLIDNLILGRKQRQHPRSDRGSR